jgi:hypothetical protein
MDSIHWTWISFRDRKCNDENGSGSVTVIYLSLWGKASIYFLFAPTILSEQPTATWRRRECM